MVAYSNLIDDAKIRHPMAEKIMLESQLNPSLINHWKMIERTKQTIKQPMHFATHSVIEERNLFVLIL